MCIVPSRWRVPASRSLPLLSLLLLPMPAAHAAQHYVPLDLRVPSAEPIRQGTAPPVARGPDHPNALLSLDDAARIAAAQAPRVRASRFQAEAARQDAVRAGRLPDPMLVVGINSLPVSGAQAFNASADDMTMRQFGLTQEIPSHARRAAQRQVAQTGVQLADANEVSLQLATRQAAAGAWVALWSAQQERRLLGQLGDQDRLAIAASNARLAGGRGTATDALAARAEAAALDNRIDAADADVAMARAGLQRWLGTAANRPLGDPPDFSTLRVPAAQLEAELDRQGPLLVWGPREHQADAAIALARADKRPNFSVSLMYGERINRPDMLAIEFGVSLPLFPGNRQDRDISARYAERDAIRADRDEARRVQSEAIAQTVATWQGWDRQVRRYRDELLPLAADRSRTALALYRGGGSLQPWLEARRDEISTRVEYARALAAWGNAWVALAYLLPDHDVTELPQ